MDNDLMTLAKQALAERQERERAQADKEAELKRLADQNEFNRIGSLLEQDLGAVVVKTLDFKYRMHEVSRGSFSPVAQFRLGGVDWVISYLGGAHEWRIFVHDGPRWVDYESRYTRAEFRLSLLADIALQVTKYEQEQQGKERKAVEEDQRRQRASEELERQRQANREQNEQADWVNETILAEIEAARQAYIDACWQWPKGFTLRLYQLTWSLGVGVEDGSMVADTRSGWSLTDETTLDGYYRFEPDNNYGEARELRFELSNVAPIWERKTFAQSSDLPYELRERHNWLVIDGLARGNDFPDSRYRWYRSDGMSYRDEVEDVVVPLAWIRTLVDNLAEKG